MLIYVYCLFIQKTYWALKMMKKTEIIKLKQVDHVKAEKFILNSISHPYIVNLLTSWQDPGSIYMLLEYVPGGELFTLLRNCGRFDNDTAIFYASEITLAFGYLHSQDVVYRDLKPENLLINKDGHIKITDFGFAKIVTERTWTLCGTPEYLAPEIIQSKVFIHAFIVRLEFHVPFHRSLMYVRLTLHSYSFVDICFI